MYADLDFEALRNLEPLLEGRHAVLGAMTANATDPHSVPNAWMASERRHPFWLFVLRQIIHMAGKDDLNLVRCARVHG